MFFTQHEIAQSRDHTLNNLHSLSTAYLEASQRLSELFSTSSRDALHSGSKHFSILGHGQLDVLTGFPATLWLEHSSRTSKLLDQAYEIVGETHKQLIQSAEAQIRIFDEMTLSSLNRLARNSPWEAEFAIKTMRTTLETAEETLHEVSASAIEGVAQTEQEVHEIAASLSKPTPTKSRTAARSRTKPN